MTTDKNTKLVSFIMDDKDDWSTLSVIAKILGEFNIPWEKKVFSKENNIRTIQNHATKAAVRGIKIIITSSDSSTDLSKIIEAKTDLSVLETPTRTTDEMSTQYVSDIVLQTIAILAQANKRLKIKIFLKK